VHPARPMATHAIPANRKNARCAMRLPDCRTAASIPENYKEERAIFRFDGNFFSGYI
jgi:hypothetical protein